MDAEDLAGDLVADLHGRWGLASVSWITRIAGALRPHPLGVFRLICHRNHLVHAGRVHRPKGAIVRTTVRMEGVRPIALKPPPNVDSRRPVAVPEYIFPLGRGPNGHRG